MELAVAFLADSVIVQEGKFYVWGGGIDTIYVPKFPAVHNVSLVARVTFEPSECGRPHVVEVNAVDEDGKPIAPGVPPQTVIPQRDLADATLPVSHMTVVGYQGLPLPGRARSSSRWSSTAASSAASGFGRCRPRPSRRRAGAHRQPRWAELGCSHGLGTECQQPGRRTGWRRHRGLHRATCRGPERGHTETYPG